MILNKIEFFLKMHYVCFFKKNFLEKPNESIYESLKQVYSENACTLKIVQYWTRQFNLGRKDINDSPRLGRSLDPRNRIIIEAQINKDHYISTHQIAHNTGFL